jgi:hypothetical protein
LVKQYSKDTGSVPQGGKLDLSSLGCPGFAVGADPDFKAMRPMAAVSRVRLKPANAGSKK